MSSSSPTAARPADPGAPRPPRNAATVPQLLARQVAATPEAIAVTGPGGELTYAELARRAHRLAHLLRRRGVGPEVPVALALERGTEVVVALAAILEAGGAYVPLEPSYPASRLATMVESTGCRLLVADRASLDRLPPLEELGLVDALVPAEEAAALAAQPATAPEVPLDPDHLAYVNFTSGSTGRPKGVAIAHRGVVRLVEGLSGGTDYVHLAPGERVMHFAPLSFDAATFEIWGPLANGATVVVHPPGTPSLEELAHWLRDEAVTTLFITTALFNQLVDAHPEALSGLRQVLFGGEVASLPHVQRARQAVGGTVSNIYGPTECTTFSTCQALPRDRELTANVPIGPPIQRTRGELLSPAGELLAGEAEGQLALGGDGLARGYVGGPAATAAAFVPDPRAGRPGGGEAGARLYRTGDLARRRADGAFEFQGRVDDQVKVRGFRIEPGEIESVLAEHPAVASAVVVPEADPSGGRRLVAFVARASADRDAGTATAGADLRNDLRRHLAGRLPDYMVPAGFELLDALPLGATGKVDRGALTDLRRERQAAAETAGPDAAPGAGPATGDPRPELSTPFVAPRTPLEAEVVAVWAEMLGLRRVGVEDDLYELGGHSLAATRILARLRETRGVEVPLAAIFENPTPAALAAVLEAALAAPSAVGGTAADADAAAAADDPVRRGPRLSPEAGDEAPLAFPQQRVWFLQKLEPDSLAYNFQAELRFRGDFRPGAFLAAVRAMVARHDVLRTAYPSRGGSPVQKVLPRSLAATVGLPEVDLSALPEERRPAEKARRMRQAYSRTYDLERPPLIYWIDFRLAADDHAILHGEHHLIHDGWGFNVFLDELSRLYAAAVAGHPARLPELAAQFTDFARWQHELAQCGEVDRQLGYWEEKLAGSPPLLELPYDRPRPPAQTFRGTAFRAAIPGPLAARLRTLARAQGATPYQVLNAGFLALLHRYTGATDLSVGTGVANRRFAATERMLGMLVNTVVLRNDLSGDPSYAELLRRVTAVTREAWAHQDVPLDRVVERVRPSRDASYNPLFQVGFHFHDSPLAELELPGVDLDPTLGLPNGSAKFDLSVIGILPREQKVGRTEGADASLDAVELVWEYSTDLFDETTMRRMVGHYLRLLEGVATAPETPLSKLPLLSAEERREVLHGFNATATAYPRQASVAELFAERAAAAPEAEAVVLDGGGRLTYGELDARSARLARRLAALGVGPEVRVALALERSLEMVVAVVAVTRAGGVYVPLDTTYPEQRLAFMLEDTAPAVVLTTRALEAALPPHGAKVVHVEGLLAESEAGEGETGEGEAALEPVPPAATDLLYVMYTSGSTGRPKGVAVPHRAVVRLVRKADYAVLDDEQTLLLLASLSFDASTLELWGALANGGRLVVMPPGVPSLADLGRVVQEYGVTTLWLTAGLFHQVVDEAVDGLRGVRQLLAGGDVLSPSHVRRALEALPGTTLVNGYGPTENTTFTCCHPMRGAADVADPVPVGRPIADTRAYVLDASLQPVPVGVPGELWAAGDGLARGYLHRPAATADAFRPDPFAAEAFGTEGAGEAADRATGARMYRTGDLARWRPDGRVEFLGRRDGQVKLRGFRVEVGEVEAVLADHPAVRDAAVVVRDDDGERRLAAFYAAVPEGGGTGSDVPGAPLTAGELRAWMGRRLPDYMLPAVFVPLDALPLNPNGKVDRRELSRRPLEGVPATGDDGFVAPRNEIEELLVDVWRELIGVERLGVTNDFFALGGHSLHATRMVHRLRDLLEIDLPVRSLYEAPTVERLAQRVEAALLEDLEGSEEPAQA